MKSNIIIFFLIICFNNCFAQSDVDFDLLGDEALQKENYSSAIELYSKAILENANEFRYYYNRAICYNALEDYQKAIIDFKKAIELEKTANGYSGLGIAYINANKYSEALISFNQALLIDKTDPDVYYNIGYLNASFQKYSESIENFNAAIQLNSNHFISIHGRAISNIQISKFDAALPDLYRLIQAENSDSIEIYYYLGFTLFHLENYADAILYFNRNLHYDQQNLNSIYWRAYSYLNVSKYDEALDDINRILRKRPKDDEFLELLNIANYFISNNKYINGDYIAAINFGERAKQGLSNKLNNPQTIYYYLQLLWILGDSKLEEQDIKGAEENLLELRKIIIEQDLDKCSQMYLLSDKRLSDIYYKSGDFNKAYIFQFELVNNIKKCNLEDDLLYNNELFDLGMIELNLGNFNKADLILNSTLKFFEDTMGRANEKYIYNLNALGNLTRRKGDALKSIDIFYEVLKLKSEFDRNDSLEYMITLGDLAVSYAKVGLGDKSQELNELIVDFHKRNNTENSPYCQLVLHNLALDYGSDEKYDTAETIFNKLIENQIAELGENHPYLVDDYVSLADIYSDNEKYSLADSLYQLSINIVKNKLGPEHPNIIFSYSGLADLNLKQGHFIEGKKYLLKVLNISKKIYGEFSDTYNSACFKLAKYYFSSDSLTKSYPLFKRVIINEINTLNNSSEHLTSNEFESNLGSIQSLLSYAGSLSFRCDKPLSKSLNLLCLNSIFKTNGIALDNSKKIRNIISSSLDTTLIKTYNDWKALSYEIAKYSVYNAQELTGITINIDSLKDHATNLERNLIQNNKELATEIRGQKIDFTAVKDILKANQCYIQFRSFIYHDGKSFTDSIYYVAYIIQTGTSEPDCVTLFEDQQLKKLMEKLDLNDGINRLYDNPELYNLIWKKLDGKINAKSEIFYSPSGLLNRISFSALRNEQNILLSDQYKLQQITHPRELISQDTINFSTDISIALFGGINYSVNNDTLEMLIAEQHKSDTALALVTRSFLFSENQRSVSLNYLPGTFREVTTVNDLFVKNSYKSTLFTGNNSLEEKFKQLSGVEYPSILHIATHGYFFPDSKNETTDDLEGSLNKNRFKESTNPLLRSGLMLTGANRCWLGESSFPGADDGILTALEISNLNFSKTKLVVLSACETGLGDINASEGVYGLQRAFKLSGVSYIIMSLWKVDDFATKNLMNSFYIQLLKVKNIPLAFQMAQSEMKAKYSSDTEKWAGFVLIQ